MTRSCVSRNWRIVSKYSAITAGSPPLGAGRRWSILLSLLERVNGMARVVFEPPRPRRGWRLGEGDRGAVMPQGRGRGRRCAGVSTGGEPARAGLLERHADLPLRLVGAARVAAVEHPGVLRHGASPGSAIRAGRDCRSRHDATRRTAAARRPRRRRRRAAPSAPSRPARPPLPSSMAMARCGRAARILAVSRLRIAFGPTSRKMRAPSWYIASISATNSTGRTRCSAICLRVLRDVGRVRPGGGVRVDRQRAPAATASRRSAPRSSRCAGLTRPEWNAAATGSSVTSNAGLRQLRRRRRDAGPRAGDDALRRRVVVGDDARRRCRRSPPRPPRAAPAPRPSCRARRLRPGRRRR